MQIDKVSINLEKKINLGNYESQTVGFTVWADVEEGDDYAVCLRALWGMAHRNIQAQIDEKLAGAYLGLEAYPGGSQVAPDWDPTHVYSFSPESAMSGTAWEEKEQERMGQIQDSYDNEVPF